jgi:tetratricopeptide (TPR) repeat protein
MPAMRPALIVCCLILPPMAGWAGPREDAAAAEESGNREAAVAAWRRVVEAEPTASDAYEALGKQLIRLKRFDEAVTVFETLVARAPDYRRGQYRLGFALRKAGRLPAAIEAYRSYLGVAPEDPDGHFGLAETLRRSGDKDAAVAAYRDYVRLENRPGEAKWVKRANEHIARLGASEAPAPGPETPLEPAPKAAVAAPKVAVAAAADPDAAFARGDLRGALGGYRARAKAQPDSPATRYRLAVTAARLGEGVEALDAAAQTTRLDPGNPHGSALAAALAAARPAPATATADEAEQALREGRLRTAARLAEDALGVAGADAGRLHRILGRALLSLGRSAEALRALKTAAAYGQSDPAVWSEMGEAAASLGDPRARDYFLDQAARVAPPGHPLSERARRGVAGLRTRGGR